MSAPVTEPLKAVRDETLGMIRATLTRAKGVMGV